MAGRRRVLNLPGVLLFSLLSVTVSSLLDAAPPAPTPVGRMLAVNNAANAGAGAKGTPAPTPKEWNRAPVPNPTVDSPELDTMRRTIDSLTPEQRQRFKENLIRWTNLSPEEKKALREREEFRRNKIAEETEKAVKETGLTLSPEQRVQFARRYGEERRQVEEKLRKEMDEKRRPMVREVISRLRAEFSPGGSVTPAPGSAPAADALAKP